MDSSGSVAMRTLSRASRHHLSSCFLRMNDRQSCVCKRYRRVGTLFTATNSIAFGRCFWDPGTRATAGPSKFLEMPVSRERGRLTPGTWRAASFQFRTQRPRPVDVQLTWSLMDTSHGISDYCSDFQTQARSDRSSSTQCRASITTFESPGE